MNSKILSAICLVLVLCLLCGTAAYAASSEAQMSITYVRSADQIPTPTPGLGNDSDDIRKPVYELVIPSEVVLSDKENTLVPIYLRENNLPENHQLLVELDGEMSISNDSYLHLKGSTGQGTAKVRVGYYSAGELYFMGQSSYVVAAFDAGNLSPTDGGTLYLSLQNSTELASDTYTGTAYFKTRIYAPRD